MLTKGMVCPDGWANLLHYSDFIWWILRKEYNIWVVLNPGWQGWSHRCWDWYPQIPLLLPSGSRVADVDETNKNRV